jgi:signal transduction histidine kinase
LIGGGKLVFFPVQVKTKKTDAGGFKFLAGGGKMGERIRAFDWAAAPVGPVALWPQSLKTVVQIILGSRYPMFVWWGQAMTNFYNDGYAPMLGKRDSTALGRSAFEVWSDVWPICGPQAEAVLNEGQSFWNEELLLVMERNGYSEEAYFTFAYSPVMDDDGKPGGVFCAVTEETARVLGRRRMKTLRDLSERTLAEAKTAVQACHTAAKVLAENPHDFPFALIYLMAKDGRQAKLCESINLAVPSATPGTIDLHERSSDIWDFHRVLESKQGQLVENLKERFGRLPAGPWPDDWTKRALVIPLANAGTHDTPFGFLVSGLSPRLELNADYGGFLQLAAGHIGSGMANARAYDEERRRADMLAELDRAKTAFFSNVSHELRTPLTLILGPLEEEMRQAGAPRKRLELIWRNSLRLLKLVNTLLDFSRIEAGRIEASFEPADLPAFTAELAGVFRSVVEKAGLRLIVDCPPLAEPVYVDRDMWEKIVFNLLSNAFKFTLQGRIEIKLHEAVSSPDAARCVCLSVRDTGTGIPAPELPHIFERFYRVRNAEARSHEGTGIGLALVHELTRQHGGSVRVDSAEGHGTTFTVSIPMGMAHLPKDRIGAVPSLVSTDTGARPFVEESLRWLPDSPGAKETSPARNLTRPEAQPEQKSKPRILLADDNSDMRDYVSRLLAARGYEVIATENGRAALEAARAQPPSLVLSDVMMPYLDGFELLRELRKNPATSAIPIILLSARAGEEARVEGVEAGADDYLTKPFSARELLARVKTHLELAEVRRAAMEKLRISEEQLRLALTDKAAHLEKLVQQRTAKLRETIGELEAFSYSIAHDMRAPLRSLQGFSEILMTDHGGKLDADCQQLLRRISGSAARMDKLIQDVLNYSRVMRGEFPLETVDVAQLLRDIVDTYPMLTPDKAEILLEGQFPPVLGNEAMLTQVFSNLMGNAVKFVPGKTRPRIKVWAEPRDGRVRLFVQDNGIGIELDQHEKIFAMFQQVNKKFEGTGIGLAIVKKAVERMGGKVGLQSEPGRGSTFWIELQPA